ncbi:hypothetical protein VSS74_31055, partial [Conexibacter stalactiti]
SPAGGRPAGRSVGRDGLPTAGRDHAAAKTAHEKTQEMRRSSPPSVDQTRSALARLDVAAGGTYGGPVRRAIGSDGGGQLGGTGDALVIERMAHASAGPALGAGTREAFVTVGAATPETRLAALADAAPAPPASAGSGTPAPPTASS